MDNCNSASNSATRSSGISALELDEYCASENVAGSSTLSNPGDDNLTNWMETCIWDSSNMPDKNPPGTDIVAYISADGRLNFPKRDVCESAIDTIHKPNTKESLAACISSSDDTGPGLEDLPMILIPYFKIIDASATNFEYRDFKDLANTVKDLGSKFLSRKAFFVIKACVLEYYGKDFNMEDYDETIDALKKFSTNLKDCRGNSKLFFPNAPKIFTTLKEKNLLPEEIWLIYIKMHEEKDDIQRRLTEFHWIDISGIAEYIKSLQETGLLSDTLLSKFKDFVNESKETSMAFELQLNRMKDIAKYIKDLQNPEKRIVYHSISEENVDIFTHCEKNVVSKVCEKEKHLKKADKESKRRICRNEHNTPFCSNCGLRTSWLKAFKKRGVYVKEAVNGTKEHIWHIDLKKG